MRCRWYLLIRKYHCSLHIINLCIIAKHELDSVGIVFKSNNSVWKDVMPLASGLPLVSGVLIR